MRKPAFVSRYAIPAYHGIILGLACGVVVGSFRLTHDRTFAVLLDWFAGPGWWRVPVWFVALGGVALIIGRLVTTMELLPGSGIPQVELALRGKLTIPDQAWPAMVVYKFSGSWLAIVAGLSLGREGPCIMIGSALGAIFARWWGQREVVGSSYILGGAAAGLAAAFGAPLAGVLFVFEEVKAKRTAEHLIFALGASFSAQLVTGYGFGLGQLFPFDAFLSPDLAQYWTLAICAPFLGLLAIVYTRGLLWFKDHEAKLLPLPMRYRTLPALMVAGVLAFTLPQILGGGDGLLREIGASTGALRTLALLFVLKLCFSIISYSGNVPGGLLMPLLCIGGLSGKCLALGLVSLNLLDPAAVPAFVVFGMAGYFAAVVGAPLTGIALVLEMTGAIYCLPGTALVALVAHVLTRWSGCPPVYDALKERLLRDDNLHALLPGGEQAQKQDRG